jgi:ribosome biogenesis GTPase
MSLAALGWNGGWQVVFDALTSEGLVPARVVGEHRSHHRVATEASEISAVTSGHLRHVTVQRSDLPGVGDFVAVRLAGGDGAATIEVVLARTSALIRKASVKAEPQLLAANVDVVFIVTALGGDFNLERMKRYLALVQQSGATPVIVVNKSDLENDVVDAAGQIDGIDHGVHMHVIGARAREGVEELEQYFAGNRTVALIGSSGVGKSTLTNKLLGRDAQATQDVRGYDGRGRHTTTSRQLHVRPQGGSILDTPGLRGLELWNADVAPGRDFDDIEGLALECRFRDCRHTKEPGCAVQSAIGRGELDGARLALYLDRAR